MRSLSPALGLGVLLLVSGCADSKWSLFRHSQDNVRLPVTNPSAAQLVAYLNGNAQQLQSLECLNLDLDCKHGLQQFHIPGKLACQKPKNFRLHADALGKMEADIGSNQDEFWYFIRRGDPYLVHCSYQDLASGVRIPFPFQPEWAMEALGMSELDPAQPYELLTQDRTYQLVLNTKNAQGQPVRKVTVFNQAPSRIQVTDHILKETSGKEICRAHILEVQEPVRGVVVPRRITFSYPAERLEMKMTLWHRADDVLVNQLDAERARDLFTRRVLAGVPSWDLARGPDGTNQVRPAGGLLPR